MIFVLVIDKNGHEGVRIYEIYTLYEVPNSAGLPIMMFSAFDRLTRLDTSDQL